MNRQKARLRSNLEQILKDKEVIETRIAALVAETERWVSSTLLLSDARKFRKEMSAAKAKIESANKIFDRLYAATEGESDGEDDDDDGGGGRRTADHHLSTDTLATLDSSFLPTSVTAATSFNESVSDLIKLSSEESSNNSPAGPHTGAPQASGTAVDLIKLSSEESSNSSPAGPRAGVPLSSGTEDKLIKLSFEGSSDSLPAGPRAGAPQVSGTAVDLNKLSSEGSSNSSPVCPPAGAPQASGIEVESSTPHQVCSELASEVPRGSCPSPEITLNVSPGLPHVTSPLPASSDAIIPDVASHAYNKARPASNIPSPNLDEANQPSLELNDEENALNESKASSFTSVEEECPLLETDASIAAETSLPPAADASEAKSKADLPKDLTRDVLVSTPSHQEQNQSSRLSRPQSSNPLMESTLSPVDYTFDSISTESSGSRLSKPVSQLR